MGTYGYISIIAMLCYGFLLLMFLTAKKNKIINSFLVVLLGLLFWTGALPSCEHSSGRDVNSGIRFPCWESYYCHMRIIVLFFLWRSQERIRR